MFDYFNCDLYNYAVCYNFYKDLFNFERLSYLYLDLDFIANLEVDLLLLTETGCLYLSHLNKFYLTVPYKIFLASF